MSNKRLLNAKQNAVVHLRGRTGTFRMPIDILKPLKTANHVRPSKDCTASCRHYRGGGWDSEDCLMALCDLQPGKRVAAPEPGECDIYELGHMLQRVA
ncbi:hypothetical protein COU14_03055 [Candidatus Kaiserbacteria bacterium CG10_big_fil_rev_8_21_14_0_10_44_10]|uniref:Uncharacterized protein n=1 Tax=Candidatus Kaiserbacteria bacterium CG10_big_fil_rev_8_21_14_0_10_44_10 TaxID=1974606 RepID=A0A2H0UGY8_9BACT|nr:MAG: hypothetical protein COU14_03055 [Candidatus Kaiserbacteria bacterium CG10_big_fil_rev_8_21_14_0_10_44_10]